MIIGTFAYCGSGQDTLADGFCKYKGFIKYSLGDVIRQIANERNLPQKRDVLQTIRLECDAVHGKDYIPRIILSQIKARSNDNIILTGIRTIQEYEIFKRQLNMILLFVYAEEGVRYSRMLNRAEQKDESTLESLKERMRTEELMFDYKLLIKHTDIRFNFNCTLNNYLENEHEIVDRLYLKIQTQRGEKI